MNALKGTARLFRLALRLDRTRLPIWIIANAGIVALTVQQLQAAYGSEAQRLAYASATAPSAVTRLLSGALTGPSLGEITIIETYLLVVLLIALMNIFLVVRHTRQNEEAGRSELMESMVVGRQASLTAALLLAFCANVVTGGLIFLALVGNDLPAAGSAAYSLGVGLAGMLFAGIAAVTTQLYESARSASGLAGLVFGVSFMVRGIGDALGTLLPGGLSVKTNPISWFSPLGWTPNMRPFAGEDWWTLLLFGAAIALAITAAYVLLACRDVGAGTFAAKAGRLHAKAALLRRFGLIWRLNRTAFIAWLTSFAAIGAVLGAVAEEFKDLIAGNEEMQKVLAALGGSEDPARLMFSATFTLAGIAAAGYGLQILTRMRAEEVGGRLELLLSAKKSRPNWLATNLIFAVVSLAALLVATGIGAGVAYGLVSGNLVHQVTELGSAILVHLPAACVLLGLSLIIFGALPRQFIAATWALLAGCLLVFQLGAILNLPQWVLNISPFAHTPAAPATTVAAKPLLIQTAVALACMALGFILFRRRDLITE